jgi:hypothetical protein
MAILTVKVDFSLSTEALLVTKDSYRVSLSGDDGLKYFLSVPGNEVQLEIVSTNEGAEASFPFGLEDAKKGAILEISPRQDGAGLSLRASGVFSIKLRKGADEMLKNFGSNLDLRLRAVIWNGGYYRGFSAPIAGGDYEQVGSDWARTFPAVREFSVK